MIEIISDKAGLFEKRQNAIKSVDEKDVLKRIGLLMVRNPVALYHLLKKHGIEPEAASPDKLVTALSEAIAENDEQFNYELATLLANPRYSYPAGVVIALITGIASVLSGGLGLAKAGVDKRTTRDAIEGELRLSYLQQGEAEKARQAQIGLVVMLFLGVILILFVLFLFKPFSKKQ